jgi:hypothetical protein
MPTATEIRTLRAATGFGLVDCRRALVACAGQADLAATWLEKMNIAVACPPGRHPRDDVAAAAAARAAARQNFLRLLRARAGSGPPSSPWQNTGAARGRQEK